jgi:hypothetical protein
MAHSTELVAFQREIGTYPTTCNTWGEGLYISNLIVHRSQGIGGKGSSVYSLKSGWVLTHTHSSEKDLVVVRSVPHS